MMFPKKNSFFIKDILSATGNLSTEGAGGNCHRQQKNSSVTLNFQQNSEGKETLSPLTEALIIGKHNYNSTKESTNDEILKVCCKSSERNEFTSNFSSFSDNSQIPSYPFNHFNLSKNKSISSNFKSKHDLLWVGLLENSGYPTPSSWLSCLTASTAITITDVLTGKKGQLDLDLAQSEDGIEIPKLKSNQSFESTEKKNESENDLSLESRPHVKKCRRSRTVFTDEQLVSLENRFVTQKYLSTPDRKDLATQLELSQLQIKTWYQNRRMKWKKQVMQDGAREVPTKPKGRPKKNSVPSYAEILMKHQLYFKD